MIINDKEIEFRHTVGCEMAIYDWCPEAANNIANLNKALNEGNPNDILMNRAKFIISLFMGWQQYEKYWNKTETAEIELGEILSLDGKTFNRAYDEAMKAFNDDGKTTVETESQKKRPGRKRETLSL